MQWMEFITVGLLLCTGGPAVGASGESPASYVTEGGDVTLPCQNVLYPNCSSTTWLYDGRSNGATDELVAHGKINDPQKHRRLNVTANCSLHINNVRAEDAGLYICQQFRFVGEPQYGDDARVFLSVLTDSPEDNNDHKETTLKTPTHTGSHTNHTNRIHTTTGAGFLPVIGAAAAVFGAVCLAAVVMVTYRRRSDGSSPPRMSENHMASNPNTTEDEVAYSVVNHPAPKERERILTTLQNTPLSELEPNPLSIRTGN